MNRAKHRQIAEDKSTWQLYEEYEREKSERELKLNGHLSSLILRDLIVLLLFLKFPPMRKQELSDRWTVTGHPAAQR